MNNKINAILDIINNKVKEECFSKSNGNCEECALQPYCVAGSIKVDVKDVINE